MFGHDRLKDLGAPSLERCKRVGLVLFHQRVKADHIGGEAALSAFFGHCGRALQRVE
jgi:hypothetical protein